MDLSQKLLAALLAGALIVAKGQYDRGFALERQVAIDAGAHHINAHSYPSWSIHYATAEDGTVSYDYLNSKGETVALTQAQIDKLKTQVVATCGDWELTNEELQYYYASTL